MGVFPALKEKLHMATRMQQRRGTEEQWTLANPVLAAGEIGFETDTNKFKLGDGVNAWADLAYFVNSDGLSGELDGYATEDYVDTAIENVVGLAPETLDTLSELAAAIGDDPDFLTTINDSIDAAEAAAIAAAASDATTKADAAEAAAIATAASGAAVLYAPLAGANFTGAVALNADPSQALQAATKQYVDNVATGIIAKPQVLGATSTNIDATYDNGVLGVGATLTRNVDGVFPADAGGASGWAVGRGILVKSQTNKAHNGRYVITDMGSESTPYVLTRCGLCDEADEIPGAYIFVQDGILKGTGWIQVVADPSTFVVGTDDINVFQFSGEGAYVAGNGLSLDGNSFSIDTTITATKSYVDDEISGIDLSTKQDVVEGVSSTEIGYLDGVTSSIQTQLNDKAPLNSPTFTGNVDFSGATVTGIEAGGGTANDDTILKAALFFGGN